MTTSYEHRPFNDSKSMYGADADRGSLYSIDRDYQSASSPAYSPPARMQAPHAQQQMAQRPQDQQNVTAASEDKIKKAIAEFGSPYATNAEWRPSPAFDGRLQKLPSLPMEIKLKQRFAGGEGQASMHPSFTRPYFQNAASQQPFRPLIAKCKGDVPSDGFENIYPGPILAPRDVSAADWHRFKQDLMQAGRLSGGQEAVASILPLTMHLGATGFLVSRRIKKGMSKKKQPAIFEMVELWSQSFFAPRGVDVFVCDGNAQRLTARSVSEEIPLNDAVGLQALSHAQESNTGPSRRRQRRQERRGRSDKSLFLIIAPAQASRAAYMSNTY